MAAGARVLSFLLPSEEEEFEREYPGVLLRAREASLAVRTAARELYIKLVAQCGTACFSDGRTFRQSLARHGASEWWYHATAFKDPESDPAFSWIIAILTTCAVARECRAKKLVLVGAASQLAAVLQTGFTIREIQSGSRSSTMLTSVRGVASRANYLLKTLKNLRAIRNQNLIPPAGSFAVALDGFWDWSVYRKSETQALEDRYFKQLPEELNRLGVSVGWLTWFDPHAEPGKASRSQVEVLSGRAGGSEAVVMLQGFLRRRDVLLALLNYRSLLSFLRIRREADFMRCFNGEGLDWFPLFSELLFRGFVDSSLPHHALVCLATERAFRHLRPKLSVSFLEHFPHSRAHYEGVRQAATETKCCAVQHASYSWEKTFLALHPALEFNGEPDGCPVPRPDFVCAMGRLGQQLFRECGYAEADILLTGSPRYDHVRLLPSETLINGSQAKAADKETTVLLVCGLDIEHELEMVDAVCTAVRDLSRIRVTLRNHPFRRIEDDPRFVKYQTRVEITARSLDDDLVESDLVLFTYSTVAEESVLKGKPAWQWLSVNYNGSALADVSDIPRFGSVAALRESLRAFQADATRFEPRTAMRERVVEELFYRDDGGAARRISEVLMQKLDQLAVPCHG
jgi:surface carbohydrate biosynthesis protein (TIGR04326 family)